VSPVNEAGLHNSDIYWSVVLFLKLKLVKYARDDWSSIWQLNIWLRAKEVVGMNARPHFWLYPLFVYTNLLTVPLMTQCCVRQSVCRL